MAREHGEFLVSFVLLVRMHARVCVCVRVLYYIPNAAMGEKIL